MLKFDWCFSAVFTSYLFSSPVWYNVETCLIENHIWQKSRIPLKRTQESHWFTPRQTVNFHSLPQCNLHWQNTSLMCFYEIKFFHRRLTIPPPSHSFHFIRLCDCLLNGLILSPGKYTICISFDKMRYGGFFQAHCVFRHCISLSSVQSSALHVLRYY